MKQPIEASDIRVGDRIETVYVDRASTHFVVTYTATRDGATPDSATGDADHYLLHRPTPPAIKLPTRPTFGWLTATRSVNHLSEPIDRPIYAEWSAPDIRLGTSILRDGKTCGVAEKWVAKFVPATTVPASALDALREAHERQGGAGCTYVRDFLAAVAEEDV